MSMEHCDTPKTVNKFSMVQQAVKNVNNCWNTNIYFYLETSGGQTLICV